MLKTMIDSPDRGWIGQRQAPDTYANGTRLFAYRALRRQLTCGELSLAVDELRAASKSLGGPVSGMTPLLVNFTDASTGAVTTWEWDFENDGIVDDTTRNPQHIFVQPGSYTVKLTVTGPGGTDDETKTGYVTVNVNPNAPVADFSGTPTSAASRWS